MQAVRIKSKQCIFFKIMDHSDSQLDCKVQSRLHVKLGYNIIQAIIYIIMRTTQFISSGVRVSSSYLRELGLSNTTIVLIFQGC